MTLRNEPATGSMKLSRGLRWLLGLTLASTAVALWWPQGRGSAVVSAADRRGAPGSAAPDPWAPSSAPRPSVEADVLPAALTPISLESGQAFDPFVGAVPAPAPAVAVVASAPPAPPPPPPPPPMNYRFMGRVVDPGGQTLVYLSKADATVVALPGTALDDGYTVQAVDQEAVRLVHPASGTQARIPIPAAEQGRP